VSDWKNAYRSFYYETAEPPGDIELDPQRTALLVIDIQNTYMEVDSDPVEAERWAPFRERMNQAVIPNTAELVAYCRERGVEVIFARIACLKSDGRDRSLSQKKPGFNYLLLPKNREDSQLVPELTPDAEDIVVLKTTDSALTEFRRRRGRGLLCRRNRGVAPERIEIDQHDLLPRGAVRRYPRFHRITWIRYRCR
jgi:nicotinamidase-related amidase